MVGVLLQHLTLDKMWGCRSHLIGHHGVTVPRSRVFYGHWSNHLKVTRCHLVSIREEKAIKSCSRYDSDIL